MLELIAEGFFWITYLTLFVKFIIKINPFLCQVVEILHKAGKEGQYSEDFAYVIFFRELFKTEHMYYLV